MKTNLFIIGFILCLFSISSEIIAQEENESEINNWQLDAFVGVNARLTPIHIDSRRSQFGGYNQDRLLSGFGANGGVQSTHKKSLFGAELSFSLKYDHVYYVPIEDLPSFNEVGVFFDPRMESVNQWLLDVHIGGYKYFPLKTNNLKLGLGVSFINRGTDYKWMYREISFYVSSNADLSFAPFYLDVEYQMEKISLGFRAYHTDTAELVMSNTFVLLETRLNYHFANKLPRKNSKKKKKK